MPRDHHWYGVSDERLVVAAVSQQQLLSALEEARGRLRQAQLKHRQAEAAEEEAREWVAFWQRQLAYERASALFQASDVREESKPNV